MDRTPAPGALDRVTTRIGDLDHPLYAEERQREVWNEASAVGFQLVLWGLLVAAAVLSFVEESDAVVPALTMLGLAALGLVVAVTHAARAGVEVPLTTRERGGWRGALIGGLLGIVSSSLTSDLTGGAWWWFLGAAALFTGATWLLEYLLRRYARSAAGGDASDETD